MNINIEKGLANPAPTTEESVGTPGVIGEIPDNSISESKLTEPVKTKLNAAINKENTGVALTLVNALEASIRGGSIETLASLKTLIQGLQSSDTTHAGQISALQSLVGSNDLDLDTVQEIVTYIKSNKTLLDSVLTDKLNVSVYNTFLTQYALDLAGKVDKVEGKVLSDQNYTLTEKNKLAQQTGVNTGDEDLSNLVNTNDSRLSDARTPVSHTHAASEVNESTTKRFVSDTEKAAWNAKQNTIANTDSITEGSTNLFWTNARTIASILTGYVKAVTSGVILVTDTISVALGKLEKRIEDNLAAILATNKAYGIFVPASSTGTVNTVVVATFTIPGGTYSMFKGDWGIEQTSNTNSKTYRLRINGKLIIDRAFTAAGISGRFDFVIINANSASSQLVFGATSSFQMDSGTVLSSGGYPLDPAINTSADMTCTLEIQNAVSGDVSTFKYFTVIPIK